jgi:putative FmdB family regulatory protein
MPRYDYRCKKCGREFEATHGIHDKVRKCDECGGEVRRVFHPVGIVFKGSGFYATDSKKPPHASKVPSDAEKAAESASSGNGQDKEKKKEAKPAGKSEAKSEGKPEG